MNRHRRLILSAALWAALWAAPAQAACDWRGEIGRARSLIQRVERPVAQSGRTEARELLTAASQRLREAQDRARQGDAENACRLARVSQSLSQQAAEITRSGRTPKATGEVESMLAATDRALEDTENRLPSRGAKEGWDLLKSARNQQGEARAAFQDGRPRMALKLTLMAKASPAQVEAYYRDALSSRNGWRLVSDARDAEGALVLLAQQNGPPLWVRIQGTDDSAMTKVELAGALLSGAKTNKPAS